MTVNPLAFYDCLSLSAHIQRVVSSCTRAEIHLFGYLSCLLWLYRENCVADWGYSFFSTREGAPFSPDIDKAIETSLQQGFLKGEENSLELTSTGASFLESLNSLHANRSREAYIDGACSALLTLPISTLALAISNEPALSQTRLIDGVRFLVDNANPENFTPAYEHFQAIKSVLGDGEHHLMTVSCLWMNALVSSLDGDSL